MHDASEHLARALFGARTAAGLSQDQLAEKSQITRATIIKMEAGEGNPQLGTLVALAETLEVPLAFFFLEKRHVESLSDTVNLARCRSELQHRLEQKIRFGWSHKAKRDALNDAVNCINPDPGYEAVAGVGAVLGGPKLAGMLASAAWVADGGESCALGRVTVRRRPQLAHKVRVSAQEEA